MNARTLWRRAVAPILAHGAWANNAELIADMARLGHLTDDGATWDGTYGEGTFWKAWRPANLFATDLDPAKSSEFLSGIDATNSGLLADHFDHVVLDPPYKLNGTDQGEGARYGVTGPYRSVEARLALMRAMLTEGARVLRPGGTLLYKCQDQTNAGRKVWQTDLVTAWAAELGLTKIDVFHLNGYRPQPQRSTCRWCGSKVMARADGRWGTLGRSGGDPYTCTTSGPCEADPDGLHHIGCGCDDSDALDPSPGFHEPDADDCGQVLGHANYSTLLVFQKDTRKAS